MKKYITVDSEAGKKFHQDFHDKGKVVMLNLLKFRAWADYTGLESAKPTEEITGEEAYQLYTKGILPELKKAGGQILFYGESKRFLIGPEAEEWDVVLLVEHESVTSFMEFAQSKAYLMNVGHRTAALEDSRLLPINERRT